MFKIITLISITWVAFGRAHQIYVIYLKGIPLKHYRRVFWNNRFTVLETGALGYLTPWLHYKWKKDKKQPAPLKRPEDKGTVRHLNIANG